MKNFSGLSIFFLALLAIFMFTGCPTDPVEEVDRTTTDPVTATYTFHENPKTEDGYLILGDFPQSFIADGVFVNLGTSIRCGEFTYYVGTDGNYYAKGPDGKNSKFYLVEPIKWKVQAEGYDHDDNSGTPAKKLLVSDKILTGLKYYDRTTNVGGESDRGEIFPNNYKESRVRSYLNGTSTFGYFDIGFLQTAFTEFARGLIETTKVINDQNSTLPGNWSEIESGKDSTCQFEYFDFASGTQNYECDNTEDKIFLLSEEEVTSTEYGFKSYINGDLADPKRVKNLTAFAAAMGAGGSNSADTPQRWMLRSPQGNEANSIKCVDYKGQPNEGQTVTNTMGVVPAFVLD